MSLPALPGSLARRGPVRLVRRACRQVLGTLGGLLLGPLLLLAWIAALLRWRGPLERIRGWEQWRLLRAYRL